MIKMTIALIWEVALNLMRINGQVSERTKMRSFRAHFGTSPTIAADLWVRLGILLSGARPLHLLCALFFLKNYNTEFVNQSFSGLDAKTFRKWVWIFVELLAFGLDLVILTFETRKYDSKLQLD